MCDKMVVLDPDEERLLAEAMCETAGEDLDDVLCISEDARGENDGENVPKSKVQFPIRRSKSSRKRRVFCVMAVLFALFGALLLAYFLLKSKTFSLDLNLSEGQVLRYRLTQEGTFEGMETTHTMFADDVFVQVVNRTGSQYWMKVSIKSLPNSEPGPHIFLVSVNFEGKSAALHRDDDDRLKILTPWKGNKTLDYYSLNLLTQLFPVVKIDLFEVILSRVTTRKHEIVVQNSKFFPGDATMKQSIRIIKDDFLITSRIEPEDLSSSASTSTSFRFEENTAMNRKTRMISKSDMELSAKLPISGEQGKENKTEILMRFKSSLRLITEQNLPAEKWRKSDDAKLKFFEMSDITTPSNDGVKYLTPSEKTYDGNSNLVDSVKSMITMTIDHNVHSKPTNFRKNKDMEEFAKSFHKVTQPGIETNFAEVEEKQPKGHPRKHKISDSQKPSSAKTSTDHRHSNIDDDDDDDDDDMDNEPTPDDDDDEVDYPMNRFNDGGYGGYRWNRFGQPVPMYGDDQSSDQGDDGDDDAAAPGEEVDDTGEEPRARHEHISGKEDQRTRENKSEKKLQNKKNDDTQRQKEKPHSTYHSKAEKATSAALFKEAKKMMSTNVTNHPKVHHTGRNRSTGKHIGKKTSNKVKESEKEKSLKTGKTETASVPQHEERNFFDRIFDQLWKDDESDKEERPEENVDNSGFKLSNIIPSFSFSSHFPFIHVKWNDSESRKKRSLESAKEVKRARRGVKGHKDKRHLYGDDGPAPYYTSGDLEPIWDIVSTGRIKVQPKQTLEIFNHRLMGLKVIGELEHDVQTVKMSRINGGKEEDWAIHISLLLSVDKHKFKVLRKVISMKEIEERFLKNSKPKLEYGTVHAGTLVLCSPFFFIEKVCVEVQLGFVLHISHSIEYISKQYPIELSIFFKHLAKIDVTMSSHMTSLLSTHGVYGRGPLFGAKIPLEIRFSENKDSASWCSVASFKSKIGAFYEDIKGMTQWSCPIYQAVAKHSTCEGLNTSNKTHARKTSTKFWYRGSATKKLHFLNNC